VDLRIRSIIAGGAVAGRERGRVTERSDLMLVVHPVITEQRRRNGLWRSNTGRLVRSNEQGRVRSMLIYAGVSLIGMREEAEY
jgi:hypothetical protein